jgi:hypothetical protein
MQQIQALEDEQESRTPAQRKIDSQLLLAARRERGEAIMAQLQSVHLSIQANDEGKVVVDITADVTDDLLARITAAGGEVIDPVPQFHSVRAALPIIQLEAVAEAPEVLFIQPQVDAIYSKSKRERAAAATPETVQAARRGFAERAANVRAYLSSADFSAFPGSPDPRQGSAISEGDRTHEADRARGAFNTDGTGVKIGVLSDGAAGIAEAQARGDLPPDVVLLTGQAGTGGEGTAMMEIIHDLAPGAKLYFATAGNASPARFAQNILDLRAAGCDIIVDDVFYPTETPFQDGQASAVPSTTNGGIIAQSVISVTASGALYFSSAGNQGSLDARTAGVWEGDFVDGGAAPAAKAAGWRVHQFSAHPQQATPLPTPANFDQLTATNTSPILLFWSDPLGASSNDYDLIVLNSTGTTVLGASTNTQDGTTPQDPFEAVSGVTTSGNRILVVKSPAAAARYIHLNVLPSSTTTSLRFYTPGQTKGHSTVAAAYSVAAAPAVSDAFGTFVGPYPNPFNSTSKLEIFTSDGPRRLYYNADGTAITPGNFSSTGGTLRQKPDITAADGVSVTGAAGFSTPFYGTSAAAPHAAAIAGLLKSASPGLTPAQIRTALTGSAIDIQTAGVDRDSGAGIVMPITALQAAGVTGFAFLNPGTVTATEDGGNGNGVVEPGEKATLSVQLSNIGVQDATNITATLTTSTPGVTITPPGTAGYPNIPVGGSATNSTPFRFVSTSACATTIQFTLTVNYTGGATGQQIIQFTLEQGQLTTTLDTTPPPNSAFFTATTGTQTSRIARDVTASSCANNKEFPGTSGTGTRRYDSYTFQNTSSSNSCVTITMTSSSGSLLQVAAYANSFNPANVGQNYLGDDGRFPQNFHQFSVNLPAGTKLVVNVNEVTQNAGIGAVYTLQVDGLTPACAAAPANQPPVNSLPGAQTTNEDTPLVFSSGNSNQISVSDPDAGGNPILVTLTATNGNITLSGTAGLSFTAGDGSADTTMTFKGTITNINNALNGLSFTAPANFNGAASLTIVTNDQGFTGSGGAQSDSDTVAITVSPVNDPPTADSQSVTTDEDTAKAITLTGSDIDTPAGSFAFIIVSGPNNGTLTGTGANRTYTPNLNYNGPDSFTFKINDGSADSNVATVSITVTGVNDAPVATTQSVNTNEDTPVAITLTGTDVESPPASLTFAVVTQPAHGTLTVAAPNVIYTPAPDYNGPDSFTFTANDGSVGSSPATVSITVASDNDAPFNSVPGPQTTNQETALVFSSGNGNQIAVIEVDAGSSLIRVTLTATNGTLTLSGTTGLSFTVGDGTADPTMTFIGTVTNINSALNGLSFTPANSFSGAASLTITANDQGNTGAGGAKSDTDSINITVVGRTLQFSSANYTVSEGAGSATITVTRLGGTTNPATVQVATSDLSGLTNCDVVTGTASQRCDYTTATKKLSFAAGQASQTFTISITNDAYVEGPETLTLSLGNPTGGVLGAQSSATLTIIDDDVAPGGPNPIDGNPFFIRQHYLDFLSREPEPSGLSGWLNILNTCPSGNTTCDRIEVSSDFFRSSEFQGRGYFIYRFYSASLGRIPRYAEFVQDFAKLTGFVDSTQLEANKVAFVQEFMSRTEFRNKYDSLTTPTAYVDALLQAAGLPNHPSRAGWIVGLQNGSLTRDRVLRELAESAESYQKFYNEAFVVMQYFGYLRRDPDSLYLQWVQTLNQTGNYRTMISGFLNSTEYRARFGP